MTIISSLTFDTDTSDVPPSAPSGWIHSATTRTLNVSDAAAIHGAKGLRLPTGTTGFARMEWTESSTTGFRVLSFYVRVVSFGSANAYVAAVRDASSTSVGDFRINTNGAVAIRNNNIAVATSSETLTLGNEYRFEWGINPVTDTQELRVYEDENAVPYFTLSGACTADNFTQFLVGLTGAASGFAADYDTILVADDWTGPFDPPDDPDPDPAVLSVLTFDGQTEGSAPTLPAGWGSDGTTTNNFEVRAAAAVHGDMGLRLPANTAGYRRLNFQRTPEASPLLLSFYFTVRAFSSSNMYLASVYPETTTGLGDFRINSNGTMSIRNGSTAVATSTPTIALNTKYRAEWLCEAGVGQELRVFEGEDTEPLFSLTGALTGSQIGMFRFGMTSAAADFAIDYDTVRIGTEWLPPYEEEDEEPEPEPVAYTHFRITESRELAPLVVNTLSSEPTESITVANLPETVYAAHRGGAGWAPQNTMAAFNKSLPLDQWLAGEADVYLNGSGSLVLWHDTTIPGGANVDATTDATWATITQAWPGGFSGTPNPAPAAWWSQLADEWGGKRLLVPEVKHAAAQTPLLNDITSRGIKESVIVQDFAYARAATTASQGFHSMWLVQAGNMPPDYASVAAAGIEFIAANYSLLTAQIVMDAQAQGLKVWAFTVNDTTTRDNLLAWGMDGFFTDRPDLLL